MSFLSYGLTEERESLRVISPLAADSEFLSDFFVFYMSPTFACGRACAQPQLRRVWNVILSSLGFFNLCERIVDFDLESL